MTIETRQTNVPFSTSLREHVNHKLGQALGRFQDRLGRARVWVEDLNGPRHGHDDKLCRIVVEVEPREQIIAEATSDDPYTAVSLAVARLHRVVRRVIDRGHWSRHGARHHRLRTVPAF